MKFVPCTLTTEQGPRLYDGWFRDNQGVVFFCTATRRDGSLLLFNFVSQTFENKVLQTQPVYNKIRLLNAIRAEGKIDTFSIDHPELIITTTMKES